MSNESELYVVINKSTGQRLGQPKPLQEANEIAVAARKNLLESQGADEIVVVPFLLG